MPPLRVAITGPESTGKSTLASFLGRYFNAHVSDEFARSYLSAKAGEYTKEDLVLIARGQFRNQINAEEIASDIVIYDTDLLVLKIWSEQKYGQCDDEIKALMKEQNVDLYLLPCFDLPWVYDPLRESPSDRARLFHLYLQEVKNLQTPYAVIRGSVFDRNYKAINPHSVSTHSLL